jgi:hypothetical protein
MALTALQAQRLKKLELDRFLDDNKQRYKEMAMEAYTYTAKTLKGTGQPVRPEDVSGHLLAAVELDAMLTNYLASKHQTQQYWPKNFTYLIVEETWEELEDEYEAEQAKS